MTNVTLPRETLEKTIVALNAAHTTSIMDCSSEIASLRAALATEPAQVPLTEERASELWKQHRIELWGGKLGINPIVFTRLIEAAHGIGAKP